MPKENHPSQNIPNAATRKTSRARATSPPEGQQTPARAPHGGEHEGEEQEKEEQDQEEEAEVHAPPPKRKKETPPPRNPTRKVKELQQPRPARGRVGKRDP